jgi:L-fuconolactonase
VIVDTHVHVIAGDVDKYPLQPSGFGTEWYREMPVAADEYVGLMEDAGVDGAVLVQAVGAYSFDNRYVVDAARAHRGRLASVCALDMDRQPAAELRRLAEEHGVSGVRLFAIVTPGEPEPSWLADDHTFPVWDVAAELDLRVVVTVFAHQLAYVARAIDRYPGTPAALDHCGFPDLTGGPPYPRAKALFELAAFPNLYMKVSSLVLELAGAQGDARDFIDHLADVFGATRLLWGSDFPQTHDRSYAGLLALARHASSRLAPDDQSGFLGGNALRLWPELAT